MKSNQLASPAHFTAFFALIAIIGSGCAGIPTTLPPEARSKVTRTEVRSYVPQEEVNVQFMMSSYGSGFGLIGAIVDAGVNAAKASSAETRAKRIREVVKDYDFRNNYWPVVSNAVTAAPWLQTQTFNGVPSTVVPLKAAAVANGAVLNIGTDYLITPDHRVFEVVTGFSLFLPGKHKKPAAANRIAYHSARIGNEEGDKAVSLWTAETGAYYRNVATEGIQETDRLFRHALDIMSGTANTTARPAKVEADFVHGRGDFGIPIGRVALKGHILDENPDRIIFQAPQGNLFSLPRSEVKITYLKSKS